MRRLEWRCDSDPRRRHLEIGWKHPVIGEHELACATGVMAQIVGVEYDGNPLPAPGWWLEYPSQAYRSCAEYYDEAARDVATRCLAPGVYNAQVRWRITTSSGSHDVLYPITLTVTP